MVAAKNCSTCKKEKPLDEFHAHPNGLHGRHSQCKECHNAAKRSRRKERGPDNPLAKRALLLKQRYGLSMEDYEKKLEEQGGLCAICHSAPARPCVDHNHETGQVRSILCHRCNVGLPYVEDVAFRTNSITYLQTHEGVAQ